MHCSLLWTSFLMHQLLYKHLKVKVHEPPSPKLLMSASSHLNNCVFVHRGNVQTASERQPCINRVFQGSPQLLFGWKVRSTILIIHFTGNALSPNISRVTGTLWLHICLISFMVTLFDITSVGRLMKYPSLVVSQSRSITCSFLLHMYYKTWWAGWLNYVVHPQKEPGVCWVYNFLFVLLRTNLIIWDWMLKDVTYVAHRLIIFWERDSYLLLLLLLL